MVYCVRLLCGLDIVADSHRAEILNSSRRQMHFHPIHPTHPYEYCSEAAILGSAFVCILSQVVDIKAGLTYVGTTTTAFNTQRRTSSNSDLCFTGARHRAVEPHCHDVKADLFDDLQEVEKPSL